MHHSYGSSSLPSHIKSQCNTTSKTYKHARSLDIEKSTMTSTSHESSSATTTNPRTPLTCDELSQALEVEVYDRAGKTETLGTLTKGKRSVLIFIRHFCKSLSIATHTARQTRAIGTNPARVFELPGVRTVYKLLNTPFKTTLKHSKCVVPSLPSISP